MTKRSSSSTPKATSVPKSVPPVETLVQSPPHELECLIQRTLQTQAGLKFLRLTVHKCPQGVCLEGLLESNDDGVDLCELVREIAGVTAINRVMLRPTSPK